MTTKLQPYQGSYLTPSLEKATVRDAMRTGVMGCEPDLPATTVARMMATASASRGASSPTWTSCAPHAPASTS
jgi:hypothetical protein